MHGTVSSDDVIIAGPMSLQHELCQWKDILCVSCMEGVAGVGVAGMVSTLLALQVQ